MSKGAARSHRRGAGFSFRLPIATASLLLEIHAYPVPALLARL